MKKDTEVLKLKEEVAELTNNWKRALADYQNLEKRYEKEKSDFATYANGSLILKLLPVLFHLQNAAEHLKDKGLDLVLTEFRRVLSNEGLEEIKTKDLKFDPQIMEAVELVAAGEKDKVAEEIQKGYLLKGKVLCPAKVRVFEGVTLEKPEEVNNKISN